MYVGQIIQFNERHIKHMEGQVKNCEVPQIEGITIFRKLQSRARISLNIVSAF